MDFPLQVLPKLQFFYCDELEISSFQEATEKLAKLASEGVDNLEEKQLEGTQVKDYLTELIAEIRENIVLSQVMHWHWSETAVVNFYVHHNKKIGVLVELEVKIQMLKA